MKVFRCIFFLLTVSFTAFSQLVEFPIAHHRAETLRPSPSARTQSSALGLPFWDDFAYSDTLTYPQPGLWSSESKSLFLNNGAGIQPPSKNVVTFDGVDSVGKPYNVNDRLAKGFADKLISVPISLDLVPSVLRNTVYLSFFYQAQGHGEAPDDGDELVISFKDSANTWIEIRRIQNDQSILPNVFYQVLIPITANKFYHNNFQFSIQNFARLSGPYDNWNVDYVYLNSGRSAIDTSFPDRTISSTLNSLFNDYYAVPYKHFKENPAAHLKHPSLELYNLRAGNLQPFDYSTNADIKTFKNNASSTAHIPLDVSQDPGGPLQGLQIFELTLNQIPGVGAFDLTADSVYVQMNYNMATKDNVPPPPVDNGDYDPKYDPIDFRVNDKVSFKYKLTSYYAFDDGTAEYGAGLNQTGSYLAFKYPIKFSQPDTLLAVDIYFPEFGDNTSQSLLLQIRTDLSDAPASILHQQNIQVTRNSQRKKSEATFARYYLNRFVVVKDTVYIGWKQLSSAPIPVGLDKNTDNASKIYYNTNGSWIQNTSVIGSIMVHPVFGHGLGAGVVTGIEADAVQRIYPNPTRGECYLPALATAVSVYDITGCKIEVEQEAWPERTRIQFPASFSGLTIVRYFLNGKPHTEKIMVRVE